MAGHARLVGYALSALTEGSPVPWHRVVNARGRISLRAEGGPAGTVQRIRLEREGVRFDPAGTVDLAAFRWRPRGEKRRPVGMRAVAHSVDFRTRCAGRKSCRPPPGHR